MLKRESLGFLRLQRFIQDLGDCLFEAALGLTDIVRGDAGPAMRHQSVQPAGTEGIMQLGIDEGLDCPTKRFGVIAYHGYSPAPVWRYVRLRSTAGQSHRSVQRDQGLSNGTNEADQKKLR
jgi:hypothetical protein